MGEDSSPESDNLTRTPKTLHRPEVEDSKPNPPAFPSIKGAWEAILFYGGIPTFTVYPLGLATLYLYQKAIRTYNHTDAWYAVSLIPKTTVLGVGAEVLLGSLSYTVVSGIFATGVLLILFPIYSRFTIDTSPNAEVAENVWRGVREARRRILALGIFLVVLLSLLLLSGYLVLGNIGRIWIFSLLGGVVGAWLIVRDYRRKQDLERTTSTKIRPRTWLLRGSVIIYVGALLSAVFAAAYPEANPDSTLQAVDLRLPKAVLDTGGEEQCTIEEPCPLLSHSDGYWNIITPQGNDILSIPDDQVAKSRVRVLLGS